MVLERNRNIRHLFLQYQYTAIVTPTWLHIIHAWKNNLSGRNWASSATKVEEQPARVGLRDHVIINHTAFNAHSWLHSTKGCRCEFRCPYMQYSYTSYHVHIIFLFIYILPSCLSNTIMRYSCHHPRLICRHAATRWGQYGKCHTACCHGWRRAGGYCCKLI